MVNYYGGTQQQLFAHPVWLLPSMLIFPTLLAVITGLYPAIRAARLKPLLALGQG
ncbi:hypothetical protein KGQ71_04150 [Patescibacteria group bacterium]|nr:hypothetical protein [Patescibacteria group bacterium]